MGLGLVLVAFGLSMVFSPVTTEDPEPSCGDRPAIAVALGSPTPTSRDPGEGDWCRDEAVNQVMGGIVVALVPGALILAWQGRRAWRALRGPEDLCPDGAGTARTSDGLEPAHPYRRLPGRLVRTQNRVWVVVEDRPDRSTLLITGRPSRKVPVAARELDVAGDTSRRVTVRAPGTAKEFVARPDAADRLRHWWTARSLRRDGGGPGDLYGPPSLPSAAVASLPRPDPLQPAWAHAPARRTLRRTLRGAGLMLAAALLCVLVILWAAVSDQDWFWEVSDHGESEGLSLAHMSGLGAACLAVAGLVGISRFLRRGDILRRQPWELADITTPELRQLVLRQHAGALGPLTCRLLGFDEKAGVRVLACKQLWFARGDGGLLIAATPDFRTMVWLRPEPAATPPWPGVDARHPTVIDRQNAPSAPVQLHDHGA